MPARSTALRIASAVACAAGLSGCLAVLDAPIFVAVPGADSSSDGFTSDAADHSFDVGFDEVLDASTDEPRNDAVTVDVVNRADHVIDAQPADVVWGGDASTVDGISGYVGPAAASCSVVTASPTNATYVGTTCDGMDLATLSCNGTGHREVVIRLDGLPGQIWDITPSGGLGYAMHLGTSCEGTPISCGSGTVDGGGMISDGPFPAARTDYFVIETAPPTPCGPYGITVTLR